MKKLDMSRYRPFHPIGQSCQQRQIDSPTIRWPTLDESALGGELEGRFRARTVGEADFEDAAELWRMTYPELYGSSDDWIFDPDRYTQRVALRERWEQDAVQMPYWMPVIEEIETGKLVAGHLFSKDDRSRSISSLFVGVHPEHRKSGIVYATLAWWKDLERTGAEYVWGYFETWHSITQFLGIKQLGFKIAGIFPGHAPRWAGNNRQYRGCVVYAYKFLGEGERFATKPEEWELLPEVRQVWDALEAANQASDDAFAREFWNRAEADE